MSRTPHFVLAALGLALAACSQPQQQTGMTAETPAQLIITTPVSGARVTSPLMVEGTATGDWYFEAQFPAQLIGADGALIAEAPARAQSNWMTEAPVPYRAEFVFTVTQETPATLVLQEDMPADNASPREITIPVILVPAN